MQCGAAVGDDGRRRDWTESGLLWGHRKFGKKGICMRRFIWTLALVVLTGGGVIAGAFVPASAATTTSAKATHVTINVTAKEWSFHLSKTSVPVGTTVTFKVTNK